MYSPYFGLFFLHQANHPDSDWIPLWFHCCCKRVYSWWVLGFVQRIANPLNAVGRWHRCIYYSELKAWLHGVLLEYRKGLVINRPTPPFNISHNLCEVSKTNMKLRNSLVPALEVQDIIAYYCTTDQWQSACPMPLSQQSFNFNFCSFHVVYFRSSGISNQTYTGILCLETFIP